MADNVDVFLKRGDLEAALYSIKDFSYEARLVWADYTNEKKRYGAGKLTDVVWADYTSDLFIRVMQLSENLVKERLPGRERAGATAPEKYRKVFLSYNTEDLEMLNKMVEYLKKHAIDFFVDYISMVPGENIKERVSKEILEREFVILLSQTSLSSSWVFAESFVAGIKAQVNNSRTIPLAIDGSLFDDTFMTSVIEKLGHDIAKIEEEIVRFKKVSDNYQHLETKRTMLYQFRNDFGTTVNAYRNAAVIRIDQNFDKGMEKLIKVLRVT